MAVSPARRGAVRRRMELDPTPGVDSARAWLVALAAFSASFVAFGVMYSFGVFLQPVAVEFHAEPTVASCLRLPRAFSAVLPPSRCDQECFGMRRSDLP